jgi:hypothetical protein
MLQQIDSAIAFAMVMLVLSLIITALVQIVLASLDLRGLNLVWALTRLFHEVDPSLRTAIGTRKWYELFKPTMGRRLAQTVSRYKPLVSGIVGRAKAIRSDELLQVLQQIAKHPPTNLPAEVHDRLMKLISERAPGGTDNAEKATSLIKNLSDVLDPTLRAQLETRLADAVGNAMGRVSKMEHRVTQWFDTVMDRSSEVFSAHSKVYTFAFAAVLAFGWHIDSGQIYRQISTHSDVRDSLNRAADSVMAQGDKLVQSKHVTSAFNHLYENSKQMAATLNNSSTLSCGDGGKAWLTANSNKLPPYEVDVQAAITTVCGLSKDKQDFTAAFKPVIDQANALTPAWSKSPTTFERCSEGVRWIQGGEVSFPGIDAADEFQKECVQKAQSAIGDAGDNIASLQKTLEDSKLRLSTTTLHYGGKDVIIQPFHLTGYKYWPHLLGTVATMLLLSLGAPFWFNTLRQLSNLKPNVAQKVESEDASDSEGLSA